MSMEYVSVESSNIARVGYDPDTAVLVLEFKDGSIYEYYDVPQYVYDGLMAASSKGSYAHQNVYKVYRPQRIR